MKSLLLATLVVLTANVYANTAERLVKKSERINKMVKRNAESMTNSEIRDALLLLNDLRDVVTGNSNGNGGFDRQECIDYTYQQYYKSLNSSDATDKAVAACKRYKNINALKALYNSAYRSYNSVDAMDLAVKYGGQDSKGKTPELKYLIEKYYVSLNGADSAKRAGMALIKIERNSLGCLKSMYEKYYRSYNAATSADKAVDACEY